MINDAGNGIVVWRGSGAGDADGLFGRMLMANRIVIPEDAGPQTVELSGISAGPANESGQGLTVTATSSNPALIPDPQVIYTSPDGTGTLIFTPAAGVSGTAVITVTVRDDGGTANGGVDTFTTSFTVFVTPVNDAPVLDLIGDRAVNEGQPLTFTVTASDPNDQPANQLRFSANPLPAGGSFDSVTGVFSWTPTEPQDGVYTITFTVTDDGTPALSASETITITVREVNSAPVLGSIGNQAGDEEQLLTFTVTASDPNDQPPNQLRFSAEPLPPGASLDPVTGVFAWTPTEGQDGSYNITFTVTDDGTPALSDSEMITINVREVNSAPVLDPIGDRVVDEGTPLTFRVTATDPDAVVVYSCGFEDGESWSGWSGPVDRTGSQGYGQYGFGNYYLRNESGSPFGNAGQPTTLTLQDLPAHTSIDLNFFLAIIESWDGAWSAGSPPWVGDYFNVAVDGVPVFTGPFFYGPLDAGVEITPGRVFLAHYGGPDYGDGAFDMGRQHQFWSIPHSSSTLRIDWYAKGPGWQGGVDESWAIDNVAVTLRGPGSNLTFTADGLPEGASLDPITGEFSWTPTESQQGTYTVTFTVADDGTPPLSDSEIITITVNEVNSPPVLAPISNQEVDEEALLTFTVSASDPNDDPANNLTLSVDGLPPGATFDQGTGVFAWTPEEGQQGDYWVAFTVTDDGSPALSDSKTILIRVQEVNRPPVLSGVPSEAAIDEEVSFTFTATATDPDVPGNWLTFSLVGAPAGADIDPETGQFTWTPTEAQGPGSYTFLVRVSDNGSPNLFDEQSLTITGAEINRPPVLSGVPSEAAIEEGVPFTFIATATDPDVPGNWLIFSLIGAPAGADIDPETGQFTWTPTEAQGPSSYTFDVVVSDGLLTDSETITVTVNEVNLAPVLDPISNRTIDEDTPLTFTATATDPDQPANNLNFTLVGAPAGAGINSSTGEFTWTPTEAQGPGSYTFDVVVSDGLLTDSETITVTVHEVNLAPVLDPIGNRTIDEDTPLTFTATATDPDLPANILSFTLVGAPPGAGIDSSTGEFTWTPTEAQGPGSFTFDVVVSDGLLTDSETITVTVHEVNLAPVLDPIGNRTIDEDTPLTFTATATDPDLPANNLNFTLVGAPPGASIETTTGEFTWTPTEAQGPGSYTFDVVVSDGLLTDSETITVTVHEVNLAPVLDPIGNRTIDEETLLTFTATASDPDLPINILSFSLREAPAGASIDPATGVFTWTPTEAQGPGSYTFQVVVSDNGNPSLFTEQSLTITVREDNVPPVNHPPTVQSPIPDVTVYEDAAVVQVDLSGVFDDVDMPVNGDVLTLTVSGNSNPVLAGTSLSGTNLYLTFLLNQTGLSTITVRATDLAGAFAEDSFIVTVLPVNDAPVNLVPANQATNKNTPLVFSVANQNPIQVSDVDAGTANIKVTLSAANGSLTLPRTTGLNFSAGDGSQDVTMTFTGTMSAINAALDGLRFDPQSGFNGAASLTITTDDLGNSGAGLLPSLTDTDAVLITVRPSTNPLTADLAITMSASADTVQVGTLLVYTIVATNNGPDAATSVQVSDTLPKKVTFERAASTQGTITVNGDVVACSIGRLESGATVTITIEVTPTSQGNITNRAEGVGDQVDNNQNNNRAMVHTRVTRPLQLKEERGSDPIFSGTASAPLTLDQVEPILADAIRAWEIAVPYSRSFMPPVTVILTDLPGYELGMGSADTVWLDYDGAGRGWYIGRDPRGLPANQVDLFTVLAHELGHLLGLGHENRPGLMKETLRVGERFLPEKPVPICGGSVSPVRPSAGKLPLTKAPVLSHDQGGVIPNLVPGMNQPEWSDRSNGLNADLIRSLLDKKTEFVWNPAGFLSREIRVKLSGGEVAFPNGAHSAGPASQRETLLPTLTGRGFSDQEIPFWACDLVFADSQDNKI